MDVLLITTTEAARQLGVGRSTLYDLIRSYRLRTVKIGAAVPNPSSPIAHPQLDGGTIPIMRR